MSSYPWEEIRAKYEIGNYTIKELAEEYGFNASYGRRRASEKGWERGISRPEVTQRIKNKMQDEEAEKEVRIREEYEKLITNIRRATYKALMNDESFTRIRKFRVAMLTIKDCRQEQWEINEIQEVAEKVEQELYGKDGGAIEIADAKSQLERKLAQLADGEEEGADS